MQLGLHPGVTISLYVLYMLFSVPLSLSRDPQLCGPISAIAIPGKSHAFLFYIPRFARISVFLFIIQRRINGLVIYMIVARANFVNLRRHVTRSLFLSLRRCNKNRRQFSLSQRSRDLHSVELSDCKVDFLRLYLVCIITCCIVIQQFRDNRSKDKRTDKLHV